MSNDETPRTPGEPEDNGPKETPKPPQTSKPEQGPEAGEQPQPERRPQPAQPPRPEPRPGQPLQPERPQEPRPERPQPPQPERPQPPRPEQRPQPGQQPPPERQPRPAQPPRPERRPQPGQAPQPQRPQQPRPGQQPQPAQQPQPQRQPRPQQPPPPQQPQRQQQSQERPDTTSPAPGPQGPAAPETPKPSAATAVPGDQQAQKEPGETPGGRLTGRQRLAAGIWPPRVTRAQLIVALLLFVLGLGLAIQVRSTTENSALRGARQEDLVRILDELDNRTERLEDDKQGLEQQRTELENSSDQAEEARKQTVQKEQQLGVLAGTVAAQGPGITITVSNAGAVKADMLLDAIQELRAAGAEAIQLNNVRIVADSYVTDSDGGVRVDGKKVSPPFRFKVIGKPQDLEPALNIPGGVVQTLEKEQATVAVDRSERIVVDALRSADRPDYARSSSQ